MFSILISVLCLALLSAPSWAFDGFGARALGGSTASTTLTVTSLADSGPGTLRDAIGQLSGLTSACDNCTQTGVLINFGVSGEIDLQSPLDARFVSCVTIDGSGQDVTIRNHEIEFRDSTDIIVTGLRLLGSADDGLRFWNVQTGVIANNNFSNAADENLSIVDGSRQISVLDNLFYRNDSQTINRGLIVLQFNENLARADEITVARNLFFEQQDRSPRIGGGAASQHVIVNNIVAEWGPGTTAGGIGTRLATGDVINVLNNVYWKVTGNHEDDALVISGLVKAHIAGNISFGMNPGNVNALSNVSEPFSVPLPLQVSTQPADDVYCLVSGQVGAQPYNALEDLIVNQIFGDGCCRGIGDFAPLCQ